MRNGSAGSELRDRRSASEAIRIVSVRYALTNPKSGKYAGLYFAMATQECVGVALRQSTGLCVAVLCDHRDHAGTRREGVCAEFVQQLESAWADFPSRSRRSRRHCLRVSTGSTAFSRLTAQCDRQKTALVEPTPAQSINRDANDGFITSIFRIGSRLFRLRMTINTWEKKPRVATFSSPTPESTAGPIGGNVLAKQLPTREDYFTLDSGLTNEQRALLGCGPFFGTRCDSSVTFAINDCDPITLQGCTVTEASRLSFYDDVLPGTAQPGGGIDLLNMEASAIMQSFPGFDGTSRGYITTSRAPAPGTIDFDGGPVCTRYVPGPGQTRQAARLPRDRQLRNHEYRGDLHLRKGLRPIR